MLMRFRTSVVSHSSSSRPRRPPPGGVAVECPAVPDFVPLAPAAHYENMRGPIQQSVALDKWTRTPPFQVNGEGMPAMKHVPPSLGLLLGDLIGDKRDALKATMAHH